MVAGNVLKGKACLLTGATGGIGICIARALAARGARLFLSARNGDRLSRLARSLEPAGTVQGWIAADLFGTEGVGGILSAAEETLGRVDVLVHSAGVFPSQPVGEITPDGVDRCLAVNLKSFMLLCAGVAPSMAENGWGRIVALGSSSSYAGFARTSVYCASKHGLLGFCRALDDEFRGRGVRVMTVSPGSVKTPMGRLVENQDFSTFIHPEDVARAIVQAMEFDGDMMINELRLNRMVMR